jgi:uncharacterized protein (TIGR02687 family)
MSEIQRIEDGLKKLFFDEGQRIIFWNDAEREFYIELMNLQLALTDVNIIRLDQESALEVKWRIERKDPVGKYLLYTPTEEPDYEKDWLLDVRLYSRSFRADRASMILADLGLASLNLRSFIARRRKFFDNKDRLKKLQGLVTPTDNEADLDKKMLAVITKAEQPELFTILRTLFNGYMETGSTLDLAQPPTVWEEIEKFELDTSYWEVIKGAFGYAEESPTLKNLLIRLLVTDLAHQLHGEIPQSISHLVLPRSGINNAVVCLGSWRDSKSTAASYDRLSNQVAEELKLKDVLAGMELNSLLNVMTFQEAERAIIRILRDQILATADTIMPDEICTVAKQRQGGHWAIASSLPDSEVPRMAISSVYAALTGAAEYLDLRNKYRNNFAFKNAPELFRSYISDLYRFDQLYRHFCEAADEVEAQNWDVLKNIRQLIEASYFNDYMVNLALSWGKFIENPDGTGLLTHWQIDGIPNQYSFYDKFIESRLQEAENRRAFVIVSDAFRYEAAQELFHELNGKYRLEAELTSQLGVLPSYTALGIASLLPHIAISYHANGEIAVDGKSIGSIEQRSELLAGYQGLAVRAEDLIGKKKEEGRDFIRDKKVVYIYHNTIDSVGDKADTEKNTFQAVRKAIEELVTMVNFIVNSLNGNYIVITADHGFLFTHTHPTEPEKCKLEDKPVGTVKAKKRYLLGKGLPSYESVWHGRTLTTAKAEGEMEFWIPRGANRFHFVGGARFIHGGAMPQEIIVPVLTVRQIKGRGVEDTRNKPVEVHVLGAKHKITTSRHRFELIQMEPVSERVKAVTLKVAIYEEAEPVTKVETVKFDSASGNMDERKKWINLVLVDRLYDKQKRYRLVLRDAETGIEQESVDVTVDKAFSDDF